VRARWHPFATFGAFTMIFAGMLVLFVFGGGHPRSPEAVPAAPRGGLARSPDGMPASTDGPAAALDAPQPAVSLPAQNFASWALLDRSTGRVSGSDNLAEAGDTMSLVKAWLAADYLRQLTGPADRKRLAQLTIMIRDSDNAAADTFYRLNGAESGIARMILLCGLTDSAVVPRRWSNTVVSARDVARLGLCLADGRAAGPSWTGWLLDEMRQVRGEGDFGPRTAFPDEQADAIAIKNGWLLRDEDRLWHVSCLAISDRWTMGVLLRYPGRLGLGYGARQCRSVAQQLFPDQARQQPPSPEPVRASPAVTATPAP
jgi:hypothetical protein